MFYTYTHSTPKGKVFYVGKGAKDRVYSKSDRSIAWKEAVEEHRGYAAAIAASWSTEEEAFEHEKFLISCFKSLGHPLVNATSGGRGIKDYCMSESLRKKKSEQMVGYKHKIVTCPHCGTSGGATAIYKWHFDNCQGAKKFKARVTIDGKRLFLGKYATFDEATNAMQKAYLQAGKPLPREFVRLRFKQSKETV